MLLRVLLPVHPGTMRVVHWVNVAESSVAGSPGDNEGGTLG